MNCKILLILTLVICILLPGCSKDKERWVGSVWMGILGDNVYFKNDILVDKDRNAAGWYITRLAASGTEGRLAITLKSRKVVWAGFYAADDTSQVCDVIFYPPGHKLGFASGYANARFITFIELQHGNPKEYLGSIAGDLHEVTDTTGGKFTYGDKIVRVPRSGIQFLFAYQRNAL